MAEVEVVRELYEDENPLKILKNPPGKKLSWGSKKLRGEVGWAAQPVRATDSDYQEILGCLNKAPLDIDMDQTGDNYVHRGGLVLQVATQEAWKERRARSHNKATKHLRRIQEGKANPVNDELANIAGVDKSKFASVKPELDYTIAPPESKPGVRAIKTGSVRK